MSGANKIIPKDQVLFHEGDMSDGMYIVRRGELLVYLEKGGNEVRLATLGAGAMLGEMALFDNKPRSASARALTEAEITRISKEDFASLMKQIPKWFVSLMATLSTRLRETNERLQLVEAKQGGGGPAPAAASAAAAAAPGTRPLENVRKILGVLSLVWHKEGIKDGKNWQVARNKSEEEIAHIMAIEKNQVHRVIETMIKGRLLTIAKDSYNAELLSMSNRGVLEKFTEFLTEFLQSDAKGFPVCGLDLLNSMKTLVDKSAYETVLAPFSDVCKIGENLSMDTAQWKGCLPLFAKNKSGITLAKASDGGVALKVQKVDFARLLSNYAVLAEISSSITN